MRFNIIIFFNNTEETESRCKVFSIKSKEILGRRERSFFLKKIKFAFFSNKILWKDLLYLILIVEFWQKIVIGEITYILVNIIQNNKKL